MGGIEPARTYIGEALTAGKHVVTANKDLIASDHGHLMKVAKQHGCDLMFEAASGRSDSGHYTAEAVPCSKSSDRRSWAS